MMKKLLFTLLLTLFSFALIAQERELSNYEKYRIEKDKELYGTPDTTKVDTVYIVKEQEPVIINNYYDDNEPNYRFLLTFGYRYPYYRPYYNYYDPFYYDWYGYYPYNYYGWNYPYYGHYYGHWYNPYYNYNHYYGHNYYSQPRGQRYAVSSALGHKTNYYKPYSNVSRSTDNRRNVVATRPQERPVYNESRRTYTPSYQTPRMNTRPQYNNSGTVNRSRTTTTTTTRPETRSIQQNTQTRSTYTRPSSSTVTRTPASTQSRTYSTPQRSYSAPSRAPSTAPSRSYSAPTQSRSSSSYSAPTQSRSSSSYSAPRSSSSSGSMSRSSSSSGSATRSSSGRR